MAQKSSPQSSRRIISVFGSMLILALLITACDGALDNVGGDRRQPTGSPVVQRTATPGGIVSVFMASPTGQVDLDENGTPRGDVVGPAATATALTGTLTAATQTAAAPPERPEFQTEECPVPTGRIPEPRPETFNLFPSAIGTYLSDGGPTTVLEGELQQWGAITPQGGYIQADTDLTGDGTNEVIVNIFDPFAYNEEAIRNAGQLLIYGCDSGDYRLLYSSPYSPNLEIPVLHRVGDLNGDVRSEIVFDMQSCTYSYCIREGQILTWNPITGTFVTLNNSPITVVNGRIGVLDVDADGILEIRAVSNTTEANGEPRTVIDIWDWTGRNYVLALREG